MDADQNDQNLPSATPSPPGFFRIPAELPGQILEHVGFSYKPPEDPLETAHKREMTTSKEQFRQRLVMIVLGVISLWRVPQRPKQHQQEQQGELHGGGNLLVLVVQAVGERHFAARLGGIHRRG